MYGLKIILNGPLSESGTLQEIINEIIKEIESLQCGESDKKFMTNL